MVLCHYRYSFAFALTCVACASHGEPVLPSPERKLHRAPISSTATAGGASSSVNAVASQRLAKLLLLLTPQPSKVFVPSGRSNTMRRASISQISIKNSFVTMTNAVRPTSLNSSHLAQLRSSGFAVVANFLSPAQVARLKGDIASLEKEQRFKSAGIGDAGTNRVADDIRQCQQCFLYPKVKYSSGGDAMARGMLYETLDTLMQSLGESMSVPLDGLLTEGSYVAYPSGGFYRRHIDSMPGTPQELRKFSYLMYLNEQWQTSDGGCLRIHTDGGGGETALTGASPSFVDVEPRAGTLVIFRSDIPHEVLDTASPRLAVAGWFNSPPEGSSTRRATIAALGAAVAVKLGLSTLQQDDGNRRKGD